MSEKVHDYVPAPGNTCAAAGLAEALDLAARAWLESIPAVLVAYRYIRTAGASENSTEKPSSPSFADVDEPAVPVFRKR